MIDPRQPVLRGQRIAVAADQINHVSRLMRGTASLSGGPRTPETSAPYTWVYAKNSTGGNVDRWGVMEIVGVEVIPTASDTDAATQQFCSMPVLTGGLFPGSGGQPCVALEPIKTDEIGRVAVDGVVQVKGENIELIRSFVQVLWEA